ncbi:MAG TPA: hypothetical protein VMU26_28570 [Candidatus Polarisedimenticolia bacterium]|nr:hypothetical protein [Candidatus Polarisedimenticolia bacterium]
MLVVAGLGRRIVEVMGLSPGDLDDAGVLPIRRDDSRVELLEKEQPLPLDATVHAVLIRRPRASGKGSEVGSPISRWNSHQCRQRAPSLSAARREGGRGEHWRLARFPADAGAHHVRRGVNPVVVSGVVGDKRVELAAEVYDRASSADNRAALRLVGKGLLPSALPNGLVQ